MMNNNGKIILSLRQKHKHEEVYRNSLEFLEGSTPTQNANSRNSI